MSGERFTVAEAAPKPGTTVDWGAEIDMSDPLSRLGKPVESTRPKAAPAQTDAPARTAPERQPPADTGKEPVLDGKGGLTINYGDRQIDRYLMSPEYQRLAINTPDNVALAHGVDGNGYYFTFVDKNTHTALEPQRHYYPLNAKELVENGTKQAVALDAKRLRLLEEAANKETGQTNYFADIDHNLSLRPDRVVQYADRLSGISKGVLATQEKALTESIRAEQADPNRIKNPYYKIFLSDVYTAQAMQPLIEEFKTTGTVSSQSLSNPQTIQRLRWAIDTLNSAMDDASTGLQTKFRSASGMLVPLQRSVQGNVSYQMRPYDYYYNRDPDHCFDMYAGAWDQANQRRAVLNVMQNLVQGRGIQSVLGGMLSRVPGGFEILPPLQDKPVYRRY